MPPNTARQVLARANSSITCTFLFETSLAIHIHICHANCGHMFVRDKIQTSKARRRNLVRRATSSPPIPAHHLLLTDFDFHAESLSETVAQSRFGLSERNQRRRHFLIRDRTRIWRGCSSRLPRRRKPANPPRRTGNWRWQQLMRPCTQSRQGWIELVRKLLKTKDRYCNQSQQNQAPLHQPRSGDPAMDK